MDQLDDAVLRRTREDYPSPIAQAARRFQAASDDTRLTEGLNLLQTLILTLGTISLAWCQYRELRPDGVQHWHDRFRRAAPTLGDWLGAARSGAKLAAEVGVALSGLETALRGSESRLSVELDELLRLRNRYAHSPAGREGLATLERHLLATLEACDFLADNKFVLIEANEPQRGGGFRITVRAVAGDNPIFLQAPAFSYPKALYAQTIYLLQEPGDHLEVAPFWVVRKTKDDKAWELFHLNRLVRNGKGFEYVNFFDADDSFVDYELPRSFRWSDDDRQSVRRFKRAQSPESLLHPDRSTLPSDRVDLAALYRQTTASMLEAMSIDETTGDKGWNHHLGLRPITEAGAAFGLRIMHITDSSFSLFRSDDIVATLWRHQLPDGCWRSKSQLPTGRPEATAAVLLALCDQGDWERAQGVRRAFERLLDPAHDPAFWSHVWSMSMVLPALATLAPDSAMLEPLVAALERAATRDPQGRILCWAPRTPDVDPAGVPSPGHTARVMLALEHCRQATDRRLGTPPEELEAAVQWLRKHPHWDNLYEEIRRPIGVDRFEVLAVRHFTRAWVVRALLEFGVHPRDRRVRSTIAEVYAGQEQGLWDWNLPGEPRIRRPVWATLDALRALEAYVLRASQF